MANTATLATLRARVRQTADMVNSTFISDAEINLWINLGLSELHDLLVTKFEDYLESSKTQIITAGTSDYALPTDFLKLLTCGFVDGEYTIPMKRVMNSERGYYYYATASNYPVAYRIIGSNIRVFPANCAGTIVYTYVPQFTSLAADGTLVNQAIPNGWEELAVLDAAIRCLAKEESDVRTLMAMKDRLMFRINEAASRRDTHQSYRIADVYNRFGSQ
jgi:hypothetical protein